jgi:hypothetical protein
MIDILDQDEEQIKEVYARFGLAMYQAQCVERAIAILLATEYGPGPTKITRSQYDDLLESLFKKTFGGLIAHLRKSVNVPSNFDDTLREALNKRNWLAHEYFWDRAGHFLSDKGRNIMLSELNEIIEYFSNLDQQVTEIYQAWAEKHGITKDRINIEMENLFLSTGNG